MCVSDNYVRSRVVGRTAATDLLSLIKEDLAALGPVSRQAFWEHLAEESRRMRATFDSPSPGEPALDGDINQPMSDQAAASYGKVEVKFGKYRGRRVDEVPLDYLAMLVDDNQFKRQVRRYLASPRIKRELEQVSCEGEDE